MKCNVQWPIICVHVPQSHTYYGSTPSAALFFGNVLKIPTFRKRSHMRMHIPTAYLLRRRYFMEDMSLHVLSLNIWKKMLLDYTRQAFRVWRFEIWCDLHNNIFVLYNTVIYFMHILCQMSTFFLTQHAIWTSVISFNSLPTLQCTVNRV